MKKDTTIFQGNTALTANNLALVTDITSGFSQEQADELGYDIANLSVNLNYGGREDSFTEGNNNNDAFYERLIIDRLAPSHPLKWHKNKVSAALFAKHFSLTDKEMNRAFIFVGQGKPSRGIKISSNTTAKGDDRYGIAAILERYPYDG